MATEMLWIFLAVGQNTEDVSLFAYSHWVTWKIDQTSFLDQTDYLNSKLPDKNGVRIKFGLRPNLDLINIHDQDIANEFQQNGLLSTW